MQLLPVEPAHRLGTQPQENRWLIDGLWGEESVGVIGAEPKSFKSFLALDMAVAVASGAPCLRRFAVPRPGRVLLFAAEDAPHVVRQRLEGIAHVSGVALHDIDIQVITAPYLWLDDSDHVERLYHTVKTLRPRLLVLDPFVRLRGRDENASSAIAPFDWHSPVAMSLSTGNRTRGGGSRLSRQTHAIWVQGLAVSWSSRQMGTTPSFACPNVRVLPSGQSSR